MNTDEMCPACKGDASQTNSDHENLIVSEFVDGEVLPPVCVVCGQASKYHVVVGEKNETVKRSGVSILSHLFGAVTGLISFKITPEPYTKEYKISVEFPVCESHRESKILKPIYIDYRRYRMAIPAHKDFIEEWKKS